MHSLSYFPPVNYRQRPGPDHVKEILLPFPDIRLLPAGSMSLDRLPAYYQQGAFAVVVSVTGPMQLAASVQTGRFAEVTDAARHWWCVAHGLITGDSAQSRPN